jgi:hypothetical protein
VLGRSRPLSVLILFGRTPLQRRPGLGLRKQLFPGDASWTLRERADYFLPMTFREFRNKAQWVALVSGVLIISGQWWAHSRYVDRVVWVDRMPPELNLLGFLLTLLTLALGFLTLPRWQSFVALAACLWVTFIFVQGV